MKTKLIAGLAAGAAATLVALICLLPIGSPSQQFLGNRSLPSVDVPVKSGEHVSPENSAAASHEKEDLRAAAMSAEASNALKLQDPAAYFRQAARTERALSGADAGQSASSKELRLQAQDRIVEKLKPILERQAQKQM